jgi:hypothetical protein
MRLIVAVFAGVLIALSICEYFGFTKFMAESQLGIVELSSRRIAYVRDPEGGGREKELLDVHVRYTVNNKEYLVTRQWTDDYWVSNGNFSALTSRFALGNQVKVSYIRGFPSHARIDAPVSWGVLLGLFIGTCILGIFILGIKMAFARNSNQALKSDAPKDGARFS